MPLLLLVIALAGGAIAGLIFYLPAKAPPIPPANRDSSVVDEKGLKTKAEAGDADAQYRLAKFYTESKGGPNYKEAARLLEQSAGKSNAEAMALLGELYAAGQGVHRDLTQAFELYQSSATTGCVAGQYNLGFCYAKGVGVAKDQTQAAKWYQLAAEGGDPIAQFDLGQRYELGLGVKVDKIEAFKWLTLAVNGGQSDAATELAALKAKLDSKEIAEGRDRIKAFAIRK
ncbi:MAG TPA: tetratricopeptide repeat protein [Verrucomicrobiae bacterium]|nr:tetratricopeptide repeat protein [Verrucomicrobiae bacterium]